MQKFRDYIYFDEERINSYIGQIKELNSIQISGSYEKETSVDAGIKAPLVKGETVLSEKTSKNYILNNNNLENIVDWSNNEKNAIIYNGEKLSEKDKDSIIVLSGKIIIPEMGENIEAINSLANNSALFDMIPISEEDKKTLSFFKGSETIPILLELDSDYLFSCNLKKENLKISNDDFYDNIDEEINIIGRIERVYNTEEDIEIFDLVKEIFKLNRAIRRNLPKESLKDSLIYEKGPLVKITPIVVYK